VSLQPQIDNEHHVFLSNLDVSVVQRNETFNLGIHKYADNIYEPGGHKYIRDFESEPIPKITYRVGGVVLTTERVFLENEDRILIKYTLVDAHSPTRLRFKPLLAFRNVHAMSKKNNNVDTSYTEVKNGIKLRMYQPYDPLFMQFSKKAKYNPKNDWYYGIEYTKEKTRGYEFKEDLYLPGEFELSIKKGESVIFSAGFADMGNKRFNPVFEKEIEQRIPRDSFIHCLENSAQQFFMKRNDKIEMIGGYHWFRLHGRDTFVSLAGLTLPQGNKDTFLKVTDTMVGMMKDEFFPNNRIGNQIDYHSVDTQLWFFRALQHYLDFTEDARTLWEKYEKPMKKILNAYLKGTSFNIHTLDNGLLWAGGENDSLTWMNAVVDGKPVINRNGLAVEVNALWYNAIKFFAELAQKNGKKEISKKWDRFAAKIKDSFTQTFWDEKKAYLADVVRGDYKDMSVRPNQLFAASLPYSPLTDDKKYKVLQKIEQELLTPRGIRTLSPKNPDYNGKYSGNITERDKSYHQGSAFPWLLGNFAEGYLNLHGKAGLSFIRKLLFDFEEEMTNVGIGTISELYYGSPPQKGKGAISHAWSVAALLRVNYLINKYEKEVE
jgi:predicted glycogen debranching enzyme